MAVFRLHKQNLILFELDEVDAIIDHAFEIDVGEHTSIGLELVERAVTVSAMHIASFLTLFLALIVPRFDSEFPRKLTVFT